MITTKKSVGKKLKKKSVSRKLVDSLLPKKVKKFTPIKRSRIFN
jgi:hypothetical protein